MEDEFPEELLQLRQDYVGLKYEGDLADDLGLVPAKPLHHVAHHASANRWRIGPTTGRWFGLTAAAAAVALVAGGVWHALNQTPISTQTVAVAPSPGQHTAESQFGGSQSTPSSAAPQTSTPTIIANNTNSSNSIKKSPSGSTTTDDSIPLWSDVDAPTLSTATAGLPSESLIMPTMSEIAAEKAAEQAKSNSQSKS